MHSYVEAFVQVKKTAAGAKTVDKRVRKRRENRARKDDVPARPVCPFASVPLTQVARLVTFRLYALKRPGESVWFEGKSTVKTAASELCCAAGGKQTTSCQQF